MDSGWVAFFSIVAAAVSTAILRAIDYYFPRNYHRKGAVKNDQTSEE